MSTRFDQEEEEDEIPKVFPLFPFVPDNLQTMVIAEMRADDRCRFSGTSNHYRQKAKACKNYLFGLRLCLGLKSMSITVRHGSKYHQDTDRLGFHLKFREKAGRKYMECENMKGNKLLWTIKLASFRHLPLVAIYHFKTILTFYQRSIKELDIEISEDIIGIQSVNFELVRLKNLQRLKVSDGVDIGELLPLASLKELEIDKYDGRFKEWHEDFEGNSRYVEYFGRQLFEIRGSLKSPNTKLDSNEFSQLSAENVEIHIGALTEKDIHNFVCSWQDGTLGREIQRYVWYLKDSNFKVPRLFGMFQINHDGFSYCAVKVKHGKDPQKWAKLWFSRLKQFRLIFELPRKQQT